MRILTATALVASAGISASAYAETHVGPRVAAIAGYDSISLGSGSNDDGAVFGLGVGYDIPAVRNVALGLDAEISGASTKNRAPVIVGGGPSSPFFGPPVVIGPPSTIGEVKTSLRRELYFGGRATVPLASRITAYFTAGYTNLRLKSSFRTSGGLVVPPIGGPLVLSTAALENIGGVRFGAGSQLAVSKMIFASLEYRYANYERSVSRHQVLTGIGLRL